MTRRLGSLAIGLAAVCVVAGVATGARPPVTTGAGVYNAGQAEEGAQVYAQRCAMCHGSMLGGTFETPGLTGKFIANWSRRPLGDLYDYVGRAMPQFAPGTLTPADDARLMAFLLKANGMPAGAAPLPADSGALHAIILEPAGAPK
jgi:mono/diheme cytochrome c family protein